VTWLVPRTALYCTALRKNRFNLASGINILSLFPFPGFDVED
jgi:hypothetical protein